MRKYDHTNRDYVKENHRFMSTKTLAENCGCSVDNILQICRRLKIRPLRMPSTGRPPKDWTEIDAKIKAGDTSGISKATKEYRRRVLGLNKIIKGSIKYFQHETEL